MIIPAYSIGQFILFATDISYRLCLHINSRQILTLSASDYIAVNIKTRCFFYIILVYMYVGH